ncbi:MAG TPA: response regulator, partial [Pseudomonadota bacterium]|nr:response regulator [Pseudomonadota bacterium]
QQVLKNLLSNAFKFTHQGNVALTVEVAKSGWSLDNEELNRSPVVLAFGVSDTGIGISFDKQQIIFEAFQQADGSTSRKYGGTGLGLAISRELSRLLGGEIRLVSNPGRGSTFTLYLPQLYVASRARAAQNRPATASSPELGPAPLTLGAGLGSVPQLPPATTGNASANASANLSMNAAPSFAEESFPDRAPDFISSEAVSILRPQIADDRDQIQPGDLVLLIVENDLAFARFLLDTARQKGFKGVVTSLGAAALALTREYNPHAMTLDICLPDMEGWRVLDRLKNDLETRHIPVAVISTEESRQRALGAGVLAYVIKPLQSQEALEGLLDYLKEYLVAPVRRVVVLDPTGARKKELTELLGSDEVEVRAISRSAELVPLLESRALDCLVTGPEPIELAPEVLEALSGPLMLALPLFVYQPGQGGEAGVSGEPQLRKDPSWRALSEVFTLRHIRSPEVLLDQVALVLHRNLAKMAEDARQLLHTLQKTDQVLSNRKILIVDDDIRNIFALSTVLEDHDVLVCSAGNGRDAIEILQKTADIDIVLMDIMMPEMDGFETMREIRKIPSLKNLPIIAVTAKAMKGDRERCIEAGAWDYLSKPVDTEQMLTVLRAWLHR